MTRTEKVPHPAKVAEVQSAHNCVVLADATDDHEQVDPTECCGRRTDLLGPKSRINRSPAGGRDAITFTGIVWQSARAVITRTLDAVEPGTTAEIRHAAEHAPGIVCVLDARAR